MSARLETGVVQDRDDRPGVFIRGDHAMQYLRSLHAVLSRIPEPSGDTGLTAVAFAVLNLRGLCDLLERSNVHSEKHKTDAVRDIRAM